MEVQCQLCHLWASGVKSGCLVMLPSAPVFPPAAEVGVRLLALLETELPDGGAELYVGSRLNGEGKAIGKLRAKLVQRRREQMGL